MATLAEFVPRLQVTDHKVAVGGDAPFVDLVDSGQEFPRFSFGGDATTPDSLEELERRWHISTL